MSLIKSRTLYAEPLIEPVTIDEVKDQLRITATDEEDYLAALIYSARHHVENYLHRALVKQTWNVYLDAFPMSDEIPIKLPKPPLIEVVHIKYWDETDTEQTWDASNYVVDTDNMFGLIYPTDDAYWPSTRIFPKSVNVQFNAGYADSGASPADLADNIPPPIKQAIKMLVGHLYENREATTPGIVIQNMPLSINALLAPYKLFQF